MSNIFEERERVIVYIDEKLKNSLLKNLKTTRVFGNITLNRKNCDGRRARIASRSAPASRSSVTEPAKSCADAANANAVQR